ncbi:hypothetical protein HRbin28_01785 [bacterium HR28]|nr:hypothetical protein HRbin28_01785 [bacterium HR28]
MPGTGADAGPVSGGAIHRAPPVGAVRRKVLVRHEGCAEAWQDALGHPVVGALVLAPVVFAGRDVLCSLAR